MRPADIFNIDTGEILNKDSTKEALSDGLKATWERVKAMDKLRKEIANLMKDKVTKYDAKFCNYWTIVRPTLFNETLFEKHADVEDKKELKAKTEQLEKLDAAYKNQKKEFNKVIKKIKSPYIKKSTDNKDFSFRFPKHS